MTSIDKRGGDSEAGRLTWPCMNRVIGVWMDEGRDKRSQGRWGRDWHASSRCRRDVSSWNYQN